MATKKTRADRVTVQRPALGGDTAEGGVSSVGGRADDDIPAELLGPLREAGVDINDRAAMVAILSRSISSSPWPSPQMLTAYRDFDETLWRELIDEIKKQTAHRQRQEEERVKRSEDRQDRSQRNSLIVALAGLVLAGLFGLVGVPTSVLITMIVLAIGGPSTATVLSRYLDRWGR